MRSCILLSVVTLGVLVGLSCAEKTPKPTKPVAWNAKMMQLSETLSELLPYISSYDKFNNPQNYPAIDEGINKLSRLSHTLDVVEMQKSQDQDPSLKIMADRLTNEIQHAKNGIASGHREYSRQVLKNTTSYCIQCHTRSTHGPKFPKLVFRMDASRLRPLEQAEFYAATRQFELALEVYEKVLADVVIANSNPFEWAKAARHALAISVRVLEDPKRSMKIVNKVLNNPKPSLFLKKDAKTWQREIQSWMRKPDAPKSAKAKMKLAQNLLYRARKSLEFPYGGSGDVLFLRATALLHSYLQHSQPGPDRSKVLLMLGQCYDYLNDLDFWALHETYYEACIHETPHTKQAEKCYHYLEESLYQGYTGSRGVYVPKAVRDHLKNLYKLASPKTSG